MKYSKISGIGSYIPETIRTNDAWPQEFVERNSKQLERHILTDVRAGTSEDLCDVLTAKNIAIEYNDPFMGTTARRIISENMSVYEAEAIAATNALNDANLNPKDVDVMCSWTGVPDRLIPGTAAKVSNMIGATNAYTFAIEAACASSIIQLEFASSLIESGKAKHVLCTQSHLSSKMTPMQHPASPNLGDAASAFVVSQSDTQGVVKMHCKTHGEYYDAVTFTRGNDCDIPWYLEGPSFYLGSKDKTSARILTRDTIRYSALTISELMQKINLPVSEIDVLCSVHPRKWIPGTIAEVLGLSPSIAPNRFNELAHVGGCGPIINLMYARSLGLIKDNTSVVLYAQGAGFTRAAAFVRF
jgi:3-oxoacyl-[acyl-carrier-protein] synthase-3